MYVIIFKGATTYFGKIKLGDIDTGQTRVTAKPVLWVSKEAIMRDSVSFTALQGLWQKFSWSLTGQFQTGQSSGQSNPIEGSANGLTIQAFT